jgi:hypothetical protein
MDDSGDGSGTSQTQSVFLCESCRSLVCPCCCDTPAPLRHPFAPASAPAGNEAEAGEDDASEEVEPEPLSELSQEHLRFWQERDPEFWMPVQAQLVEARRGIVQTPYVHAELTLCVTWAAIHDLQADAAAHADAVV